MQARLTIYHITLSPGLQYPPHNQLMDALIGICKGGEMNFVYLRAMMAFGAVAVIALMLHRDLDAYLVAAGLFAHAAWDVCHVGRTRSWCAHWLTFASSWIPPWSSPLSSQPYEADQRRPGSRKSDRCTASVVMSYAIFFPQLNLREGAMLDFWGVVAVVVAIAVNLTAIATIMPLRLAGRLALAALSGAWVGAAAALAAAGELADATSRLIPLIGVLFAAPLLLMALWALISARPRTMLLEIPMPLLIGLNIMRVFGLFFVLLASAGRLGGPFPYSAGWGDVITGVAAIPVAYLAARDAARHARVIAAWNLFGTLDLIVAVFLGVTSTNGSSLQLIDAGAGSAAMQYLPYSLVPTVLVPFYLVTHAIIFAQLASSRRVLRPA